MKALFNFICCLPGSTTRFAGAFVCIRKLATDHLPSSMTLPFMIHLVNTLLDPSYLLASFVSYHTRIWVGERCASDGVARG